MKFIPLYDRVLVQVLGGVKEVGGFVLPDNARDDYLVGSVISTGFGYRKENGDLVPLLVKPGMVAMFGPHAGTPIQVDNKPYLTMRELELVGILCAEHSPCGICPDCETSERRGMSVPAIFNFSDGGLLLTIQSATPEYYFYSSPKISALVEGVIPQSKQIVFELHGQNNDGQYLYELREGQGFIPRPGSDRET